MSVEERLAALEQRLRAAEDQLEIIRLLNTYGPAVDSGASRAAAELWVEGGAYDAGGVKRFIAPKDLTDMYDDTGHQDLIHTGSTHLTATPRITLHGDTAEAVAYSYVVKKEGDRWFIWRAAANYWTLVRTEKGWRIKERFNRVIDGSKASHETLRRALAS
jgi:hypothetical protein